MFSLTALVVLIYVAFVFLAESFNPFVKPRLHVHRVQWRYGLRMALAVLIGGASILAMLILTDLTLHIAIATGLSIAAVLALCFSVGKIRHVLHG